MKICMVSTQLKNSSCGIGYYTRMLAEGLARLGHCLTLILPEHEVPDNNTYAKRIIPISCKNTGSHADWLKLAPGIAREVKRAFSEQKFDILYFTQARDALLYRRSDFPGPVLGGVHDYYFAKAPLSPNSFRKDYVDWPKRWIYYQVVKLLECFTYRRVDGLIFNSMGTQKNVVDGYRLSGKNQLVCYYGVNKKEENTLKDNCKEPIILFVGGNLERKGLPAVLRALPSILNRHPEYKLVVVGDYANRDSMERLAADLRVQDKVIFLGYQPNEIVNKWHKRAKIFVMPSLMEGFGIVFLEAMRTGTPVIATRVGGIPEVVTHNENGLIISPNQPDELAQSCIKLLSDSKFYNKLSQGAYSTIHKFPPETMVQSTENYFQTIITQWHS